MDRASRSLPIRASLARILGGWQASGTFEYQPGALLDWDNIFFYGDVEDIAIDNPQIALQPDGTIDPTKRWFNIDAGFERDPARQPAAFQKRVFPFRVDGVRGFNFTQLNLSFARRFNLGGRRTLQFRVDMQNALNRQQWGNPNVNPLSTNFGLVTTINATTMRFISLGSRRSLHFRVDMQNALNRQQWENPNVNPLSTNFGLVTTINASTMRFISFGTRFSF